MDGQPGDRFVAPGIAAVAITGGTAAERDQLRGRLEAAGVSIPVETVEAGADTAEEGGRGVWGGRGTAGGSDAASGASALAGVVRLATSESDGFAPSVEADFGGDASDPENEPEPEDNPEVENNSEVEDDPEIKGDSELGERPEAGDNAPLIVVGSDVDVAAAYGAGASHVIPLAPSALPEAAVDRMAERLRRGWRERVASALFDRVPLGVTLHRPGTGDLLAHDGRCRSVFGLDATAGTDAEVTLSDLATRGDVAHSAVVDAIERAAAEGEATVELGGLPEGVGADALEWRFDAASVGGERFVVGWLRDVSDRADRERSVERYETILESIGDAVYAIDAEGTIEYVNQRYASMKGVDRETLLGTNIYDWVSEETEQEAKEVRAQLRSGHREVGTVEYEFQSVDGEVTPAEIRFVEIPGDGETVGGAGVIRDISDRKSYERRLERQNERLEGFASVVSHDLRNPLSVAGGRLELAREECDSEHLDAVADAHDRMTELIDDLLTLAREGDDVRELESVDLASVVESCWGTVETRDATIDVDTDRPIRADPGRLRQLLENLIRNSVEHGSTSSRTESDDAEHAGDGVSIRVGPLEGGFYVADDGPGIPEEKREAVFEVGHSTDPDGTGFGLSIVTQVAEAHGWAVTLTDAEGGGARFEFTGVEFGAE